MFKSHPVVKKCIPENAIPDDCIGVRGKIYPICNIKHPGGSTFIEMCAGCDATPLYESHHLNIRVANNLLDTLSHTGTYTPSKTYNYGSYSELRRRALNLLPTRASRTMDTSTRCVQTAVVCLTIVAHIRVLNSATIFNCVLSACLNTVCGGFGHNFLHRLEMGAILLDWNGLSCYEWLHEHVHSHHMYVNTRHDHDALSMEPFLYWLERRGKGILGPRTKHLVYAVAEVVVALQGNLGHRMRWSQLYNPRLPLWLRIAPFLFLLRVFSHVIVQGWVKGGITLFFVMSMASFYFATIAHMSHAVPNGIEYDSFLDSQLGNTVDVKVETRFAYLLLFLDRQRLHHLFPSVDHTRLFTLKKIAPSHSKSIRFLNKRVNKVLDTN